MRILTVFSALIAAGLLAACASTRPVAPVEPAPLVTLRTASAGLFQIGVGLSDRVPRLTNDWPLLRSQFSILTPENGMKPAAVQASPGMFRFAEADAFVDFAQREGLQIVGHCLVWAKDDRTPPWFFQDAGRPASRDLVLERLRRHVRTQVERYKGRIAEWDVVNEALDDGTNYLRPSGWTAACGEDFIAEAFRAAHEADPAARLVYNDYNNELPDKRAKLLRLVRSLKERGVPLHAVGLQGHYQIDEVPFADIEATLVALREMGVKAVVSELDIDMIPRGRWWADGGKHRAELAQFDPYRDGCPPELLRRQAEQYARLFQIFRRHADVIARVSFWNLHDGQSWLNDFPWTRTNHPLLFDRQGRPKPAYDAVLQALTEEPAR